MGKLTCGKFVARHGLDTTDASEFCSPQFDRQVQGAASLQATQPPAADRLRKLPDCKPASLAILVPTVTPNAVDVVSRHIHNYQYNPVWGALLDLSSAFGEQSPSQRLFGSDEVADAAPGPGWPVRPVEAPPSPRPPLAPLDR